MRDTLPFVLLAILLVGLSFFAASCIFGKLESSEEESDEQQDSTEETAEENEAENVDVEESISAYALIDLNPLEYTISAYIANDAVDVLDTKFSEAISLAGSGYITYATKEGYPYFSGKITCFEGDVDTSITVEIYLSDSEYPQYACEVSVTTEPQEFSLDLSESGAESVTITIKDADSDESVLLYDAQFSAAEESSATSVADYSASNYTGDTGIIDMVTSYQNNFSYVSGAEDSFGNVYDVAFQVTNNSAVIFYANEVFDEFHAVISCGSESESDKELTLSFYAGDSEPYTYTVSVSAEPQTISVPLKSQSFVTVTASGDSDISALVVDGIFCVGDSDGDSTEAEETTMNSGVDTSATDYTFDTEMQDVHSTEGSNFTFKNAATDNLGNTYTYGFLVNDGGYRKLYLKQKFSQFTGSVVWSSTFVAGTEATVTFYDEYTETELTSITINPSSEPVNFDIDVSGVSLLTIEVSVSRDTYSNDDYILIANGMFNIE